MQIKKWLVFIGLFVCSVQIFAGDETKHEDPMHFNIFGYSDSFNPDHKRIWRSCEDRIFVDGYNTSKRNGIIYINGPYGHFEYKVVVCRETVDYSVTEVEVATGGGGSLEAEGHMLISSMVVEAADGDSCLNRQVELADRRVGSLRRIVTRRSLPVATSDASLEEDSDSDTSDDAFLRWGINQSEKLRKSSAGQVFLKRLNKK